jgi:hypothetical protein
MALEIKVLDWDRHKYGRVKPVNGIPTLHIFIIGSPAAI